MICYFKTRAAKQRSPCQISMQENGSMFKRQKYSNVEVQLE
jgi:hypothetical protein